MDACQIYDADIKAGLRLPCSTPKTLQSRIDYTVRFSEWMATQQPTLVGIEALPAAVEDWPEADASDLIASYWYHRTIDENFVS